MSIHIKPPSRACQREPEAAEPTGRTSRFDQRGIALQTVIIMVVLLAIAGAVAAVLLGRTGDVTTELENQDVTLTVIDTPAECARYQMGGQAGVWTPSGSECTWGGTSGHADVTASRCAVVSGQHSFVSSNLGKCVVS